MGFIVITKWSCEFMRDLIQNEDIKDFVQSLDIQEPINLRDCYFGGRTNALVLHKEFSSGEKGCYVDFTSLYPDILKYKRFPIGHLQRIVERSKGITTEIYRGQFIYANCEGKHLKLPYFGLIKAKFLPPTKLIHPVLPLRCNGKLKFPLCYKCASEENPEECGCPVGGRGFIHAYCTPEVEIGINMGYIIEHVYEVLHWSETEVYDPKTKKGGIFTEYINTFLKLKQQASGFPASVSTEEEKQRYIQKYFEQEGILLDEKQIEKNSGLRSLAKLALNSFYENLVKELI